MDEFGFQQQMGSFDPNFQGFPVDQMGNPQFNEMMQFNQQFYPSGVQEPSSPAGGGFDPKRQKFRNPGGPNDGQAFKRQRNWR
jgi:hypothetical protein